MSDLIVTVILAAAWALAATYFLTEVVRQRPFRRPLAGRASRSQSLALALLCAGLALNPTAALLRDHRTLSISLSILGLLCLAAMMVVFVVQGWNSQQGQDARSGGLDRTGPTAGDHPGEQARSPS
ncbi:hypothetical protein [Parafrankia discariae]|uniref:hypothetical protein n=1 Tax=Parafrankia discariae TaxID=365528 RepID=UPI00037FAD8D|nr:hypothetical protein [Parafrankia discariae]